MQLLNDFFLKPVLSFSLQSKLFFCFRYYILFIGTHNFENELPKLNFVVTAYN